MRQALIAFIIASLFASTALAQDEVPTPTGEPGVVAIVLPEEGAVISGTTQIVGSAQHPDFRGFVVEYAQEPPVGAEPWTLIQAPVGQQVGNSVLAVWDTTLVADDRYILRLRVLLNSGDEITAQVGVTVANATPTPLPTLPPQPTIAPPATATAGPSPTPLIIQPPTRTPRPAAVDAPQPTEPVDTLAESPLAFPRLRQAACRGAIVTVVIFAGIGVYGVLRSAYRRELRILVYQIGEYFRRR
ncbi:MAG: hypothetical protein ACFB51_03895 [Anaerolineae bacterium]